jgi:hypothetical protein
MLNENGCPNPQPDYSYSSSFPVCRFVAALVKIYNRRSDLAVVMSVVASLNKHLPNRAPFRSHFKDMGTNK